MKKNNSRNLPLILVILDGWGLAKANKGNAVLLAKTPTMDGLIKKYPNTELRAHGKYVGLPRNQVGNSEAGHLNIGAGRLVEQDSTIINRSIKDGTFLKNSAFSGALRHIKKKKSKVHLIGMLSNGQSPHSDPLHLLALLDLLRKEKVSNVYLHLFTDGRDSPKFSSLKLIDDMERYLTKREQVSTIMGRFYAMDRKKKWERTEKAFNALVFGVGRKAKNSKVAITEAYNRGNSDEFIEPCVFGAGKEYKKTRIENGDSVIFFNLRSDRGRQLTKAFIQADFNKMNPGSFKRKKKLDHLYFVAMTDFGPDLDDIITAFPSVDVRCSLPMQLAGLKQLYISETEKYAHVTYFFNGGYSGKVAGEDHLVIPSPDVKSYDQTPIMKSKELAEIIIKNLKKAKGKPKHKYDFTVLNFAAPDMIGHTGNLAAAIECCQKVDKLLGKIVKAYLSVNGTIVVAADHGNIEKMINLSTGELYTQHTTNHVPMIIVNKKLKNKLKLANSGILGDIAPTILKIVGVKKPREMTGKSLILNRL
ncbi:MAG: 2,3-bisphosphoglycerate-independent phosphoglycerate mutase [Patescibacteria group bacterium]|nr:2,3-bisphosphoglycerate-independent phosphoglycerate mutase [Patescibacteria group bacterium]